MAGLAAPLIGLGTSIIGGFIGSSAAKKAAEAQRQSANSAASKIIQTATDVNKGIGQAEVAGNSLVSDATGAGQHSVMDATGRAVDRLTPYSDVGSQAFQTLGSMLGPDGSLMKDFTGADMQKYDPGYQFRLDQASKALSRSAAGRGASGGGVLKSLNDYAQNAASAEFGNAFNRFDTNRKFQFGALSDVSKTGLQAGVAAGQFDLSGHEFGANLGMQGSEFQANNAMHSADSQAWNAMRGAQLWGDDIMGAGNAQASGYMGAANAWTGALNGASQAATQYFNPRSSEGGGAPGGFTPYSQGTPYTPIGYGPMPSFGSMPSSYGYTPDASTYAMFGNPVAPSAY